MNLSDTVVLMQSDDYKERLQAEYFQTKIRHDKLCVMIVKYETGTLPFTPSCSIDLFKQQCEVMAEYLHILEGRASIEGVSLELK